MLKKEVVACFWYKYSIFVALYIRNMKYKEIVSVTGLSGLYQLLSTKSDGAIVRNIGDKTTKFISARKHNVTPLESIEVYTIAENVRLHNVFQKMQEHETDIPLIDHKTATKEAIKSYFKSVFPEFDEDRVYASDMKKMLKWYELLKSNDLLQFAAEDAEGGEDAEGEEDGPETDAPVVGQVDETQEKEASLSPETTKEQPVATVENEVAMEQPGE